MFNTILYFLVVVVLGVLLYTLLFQLCLKCQGLCIKFKVRSSTNTSRNAVQTNQQQSDIYSISGRVQGQPQGTWPTHNGHVSLDNFTIANEQNKHNDAPPSYEEAMSLARTNNAIPVVMAVPKSSANPNSTPPPYTSTN